MIHLTEAAAREIRRWQGSRQLAGRHFRLGVARGGCCGWYYTLELSESCQPGDSPQESQGIALAIPPGSDAYLKNLQLDYAEDLMGGGFRFHNPNAASTCSCGLSFVPEGSEFPENS